MDHLPNTPFSYYSYLKDDALNFGGQVVAAIDWKCDRGVGVKYEEGLGIAIGAELSWVSY